MRREVGPRTPRARERAVPGSTLEITREYRAYVEDFMKKHAVKSVVDAGCGDWSFSSAIDWGDASYLGVDIASDVIEAVRKKHEKGKIKFEVGDITEDLPAADLLISKDVLQHLSNELIHKFIKNNLRKSKYKWVILTNDRSSENQDIRNGEYRMIDLTAPPFNVKGLVDLPIKYGTETRRSPRSSTSRSSPSRPPQFSVKTLQAEGRSPKTLRTPLL